MKTRWWRLVAAAALLCTLLVLGPGAPAPGEAKTTLTMWSFLNPEATDARSKALKTVMDMFMAENPDVEIKAESVHWGKIDGLVIQAVAAGGGPDLIGTLYSANLTQHAGAKSLAPLNSYLESWYAKNKADYFLSPENTRFDGKVLALPWEFRNVGALWYRQDMLEKAGLKLPKTLDELAKAAQHIGTERLHGLLVPMSETMLGAGFVEAFEPLLWTYGGTLLDAKGQAAFNGPAGERAMKWATDLTRTGAMGKSAVTMNSDDILSGVKAGTVAMAFAGTHRIQAARAGQGVGQNLRTAPMPGLEPGKPAPALIAGQTIAIGAKSKNKEAAWRFIEYFLAPKAQMLFAKGGISPVRKSVYSDPYFQTPEGREKVEWKEYVEKYGRVGRYPEDFAKLSELLARAAQDIVLRSVPVKRALDDAAAKYNAQAGM